jgi:hypothetical protein
LQKVIFSLFETRGGEKGFWGRYDIQHNDTQHNDTQNNDTQHNDTQLKDTQHKTLILRTFGITTLSAKGL